MMMLMMLGVLAFAPQDAREEIDVPMISVDELTLHYYPIEFVEPEALHEELSRLIGRSFYVKERGGYRAQDVHNLRYLGDSLIVYDTPEYAKRVLAMANQLDIPSARQLRPGRTAEDLMVEEYRPRYLSMETVHEALRPYTRNVFDGFVSALNISVLEERGLFVIRDTSERLAEIRSRLDQLDRPERQVLITCWLVTADEVSENERVPLPDDLLHHMKALVPQYEFKGSGFGMLRTSASPGRERIVNLNGDGYGLRFHPLAYDTETGSLSVEDCALLYYQDVSFTTNTVLSADQYTVIGATGAKPIFVVIKVRKI